MTTEAHSLHAIVYDRIRNLLAARHMFRRMSGAEWPSRRQAVEIELRALLALARAARKQATAEPDPIDLARGFAEWQAGTLLSDSVAWVQADYHDYQAKP